MKTNHQSNQKPLWLLLFSIVFSLALFSQNTTQTIRGKVMDKDNKLGLPGVNIVVLETDPLLGAVTDINGEFQISGIPLGRYNVQFSFIGYSTFIYPNLIIQSGNEAFIEVELLESSENLEEVDVTAYSRKRESTDDMVLLSGTTISVEETKRFAGAIDDPARMVQSFAGITSGAEGSNDIVVRGNSPRGILWRLEGVEIPNPNHFADEGYTGGPINALNSNMLGLSDFYTGAFAPAYGNALSGVMDMKLRNGNNSKRSYSATLSVLGTDLTAEGPFSSEYSGSYLANYRYSTLSLLSELGILDFGGIPKYQDASFKVNLPINMQHSISIFGLGGHSTITDDAIDPENEDLYMYKSGQTSAMGVLGINHTFITSEKGYLKNSISISGSYLNDYYELPDDSDEIYRVYDGDFKKTNYNLQSTYHHKFNSNSKIQAGLIYKIMEYDMTSNYWNSDIESLEPTMKSDGNSYQTQAFISWKYRFRARYSIVSGMHLLHFGLNNSFIPEPRLAVEFAENENRTWTIASGLHSKVENVSVYLAEQMQEDGSYLQPNLELSPSRSAHFVFGMNQLIGEQLHLKTELYYQYQFDVPVENDPSSNFSLLNSWGWYTDKSLVNEGTGENYGIEITLEKYFSNGYYYMGNVSLYSASYIALDGIKRHTTFDGNYVFNALGGKEWSIGQSEKNRTLFSNAKLTINGGQWYTPIELTESIIEGEEVRNWDNPWSKQGDMIFKLDIALGIRRSYAKWNSELKLDIQNVTNHQAVIFDYYNKVDKRVEYGYQLGILPVLSYKVSW